MLDARETFEKYERRSPQPPPQHYTERREYTSCEYRRDPQLACELRAPPIFQNQRENERLACGYRQERYPQEHGQLACELRARPTTTITTYLPENNKKKIPIGLIVGVSICIPITIAIIIFAAVWLQEVGII